MYKTIVVFLWWSIVQLAVANNPRTQSRSWTATEFKYDHHSPRRVADSKGILESQTDQEPSYVRAQRSPDLPESRLSAMEISAEGASKAVLREHDGPPHLALEVSSDGVPLTNGVIGDSLSVPARAAKEILSQSKPSMTVAPSTSTRKIADAPPNIAKLNGLHLEQLKRWSEQEKLNSFVEATKPLDADDSARDSSLSGTIGRILDGLSGGTGTVVEPNNKELDHLIRFRMRMQDSAVLVLLMIVYLAILIFMYTLIYRMSHSDSTVKYYCDPQYHRLSCSSDDVVTFLSAFNKKPDTNKPQIRVAGFAEGDVEPAQHAATQSPGISPWRGKNYKTLFYYALDLDCWTDDEGMVDEKDRRTLEEFLVTRNPLQTVEIRKEMIWKDFEEVATKVKAKIRACGFQGPLDVCMSPSDTCRVFQNTRWANFMFNETVKVMTLLSVIGGVVYLPYMWIRSRNQRKVITSKFNIRITGEEYWRIIGPQISENGFGVPQGETPSVPQIMEPSARQGSEENEGQAAMALITAYGN